jgi:flagella basal body P-ring formation protein FlgA
MKPQLVHRDDNITLVYEVPGILLTILGKALEPGAEGDVINVLNAQSKRTIQGVVTGPNRVNIVVATAALSAPDTAAALAAPASPAASPAAAAAAAAPAAPAAPVAAAPRAVPAPAPFVAAPRSVVSR